MATIPITTNAANSTSFVTRLSCGNGNTYKIKAESFTDEALDEVIRRLKASNIEYKSISCLHCGAPITMRIGDHIAKCQYCHSVYAIDVELIRDIGGKND